MRAILALLALAGCAAPEPFVPGDRPSPALVERRDVEPLRAEPGNVWKGY